MRVVFTLLMSMAISVHAQIFDCFPFFNELDLLEVRLHELYNSVDKFVLVEWTQTHSGKEKPLYYELNKERFEKFADKIVHVVLTGQMETDGSDRWGREHYQREQIMQGLLKCNPKPNDIVIVSDLDEIVSASTVPIISHVLNWRDVVGCTHDWYVGYLNMHCKDPWYGAIATKWKYLTSQHPSLTQLRLGHHLDHKYYTLKKAGWHFSWMGGKELVIQKIESYAHDEHDTEENKQGNFVLERHQDQLLKIVPIDRFFPKYIYENIGYFDKIGFIHN